MTEIAIGERRLAVSGERRSLRASGLHEAVLACETLQEAAGIRHEHDPVFASSLLPHRGQGNSDPDPDLPLWNRIRICDDGRCPAFFVSDGRKATLRHDVEDHS